MPKTYSIKTYQFSELSDKAKKKAVELLRNDEYENYPTESVTEVLAEKLEDTGYPDDNISWSLACCQGDGVSFVGRCALDVVIPRLFRCSDASCSSCSDKVMRLLKLLEEGHLRNDITNRGNYCHANSMRLDVNFSGEDKDVELVDELETAILADIRSLSYEMEKIGYAQIEALTSEEVAIENAEANETEFNEDGTFACLKGAQEA